MVSRELLRRLKACAAQVFQVHKLHVLTVFKRDFHLDFVRIDNYSQNMDHNKAYQNSHFLLLVLAVEVHLVAEKTDFEVGYNHDHDLHDDEIQKEESHNHILHILFPKDQIVAEIEMDHPLDNSFADNMSLLLVDYLFHFFLL